MAEKSWAALNHMILTGPVKIGISVLV
jgi:hypothetical protein